LSPATAQFVGLLKRMSLNSLTSVVFLVVTCLALSFASSGRSPAVNPDDSDLRQPVGENVSPEGTDLEDSTKSSRPVTRVKATLIHPYRSAGVGAEVEGIVQTVGFAEGDRVEKGRVVVKISPERYAFTAKKARAKVKRLEIGLAKAEAELQIQKDLMSLDATARLDLIRARAAVEVAQQNIEEARLDLEVALLNLQDCTVKAPFTGYLIEIHKQPHETVKNLEKLFTIMDVAKVYAVANIPEKLLSEFPKGARVTFRNSLGKRFVGTVDKVAKNIDPKSVTRKVYVLIDNSSGELPVGSAGSVEPMR